MISVAQAKRFLAVTAEHHLEALFVLAMTTGTRSAELLGLTWDSVDLESGMMVIDKALERVGSEVSLSQPKTKKSRRSVALTSAAVTALTRNRARQAEQALSLGAAWQNELNLVFTNAVGGPLDRHNLLRREFRPLLKKTDLPQTLRFHDLRHIAASLALGQGLPVTLVSEMLGHASTSTTLDVYGHVIPATQRQVADEMERLLA